MYCIVQAAAITLTISGTMVNWRYCDTIVDRTEFLDKVKELEKHSILFKRVIPHIATFSPERAIDHLPFLNTVRF